MRRPALRRPEPWTVVALAIYVVTALVLTWPMPADLSSRLYGQGGDAFGGIGQLQELLSSHVIPFFGGTLDEVAAPEGRDWSYPLADATWASVLPRWLLSVAFGAVAGWNLMVLLGYVLTGLATFLLARRLTGSAPAALIAGWAYAFFPYMAVRGGAHVDYIHGWVFVLVLWRVLELRAAPTVRNGLWMGASLVLCVSFNPYFVLLAGVVVAVLVIADLFLAWRERQLGVHVKAWAAGLWMTPVVLALYLLLSRTTQATGVPTNAIGELYVYNARLLDYLIPVRASGLISDTNWIDLYDKGFATGERGLYLGWVTLALAALAVGAALARRFDLRTRQVIAVVTLSGVVAAIVSAPPTFQPGGITIYMPSWFIFHASPTWRVYSRFAIVIMLSVALLAAFGIALLLRNRRPAVGAAAAGVIAVLVVMDLWWNPEPATTRMPDTAVHRLLAQQRDNGIVAEYPLTPEITPDYRPLANQDAHHHPLLNGYAKDSFQEDRALWLSRLDDPRTPGRLAGLGVRWVITNDTDPYATAEPFGQPGKGLELVQRADGRSLYRVTAAPAKAMAYPWENFGWPEGQTRERFEWLFNASAGTLRVEAWGCETACAGELRFVAQSFAEPRRLTIRPPGGKPTTVTVPSDRQLEVRVPMSVKGAADVRVSATPAPRSPRQVSGAADDRLLSVAVTEPDFVVTPGA